MMMKPSPLRLCVLCALLLSGHAAAQDPFLESRVAALERTLNSQLLVDTMRRLDMLEQETRRINGVSDDAQFQVGELSRQVTQMQGRFDEIESALARQAQAIEELARALNRLSTQSAARAEPAPAAPESEPEPQTAPQAATSEAQEEDSEASQPASTTARSAKDEENRYSAAFEQMKRGRYEDAAEGFRRLVEDYPDGAFAANATYWLGEALYVEGDFSDAMRAFESVIRDYRDSAKRPDAILKKAYCLRELGRRDDAAKVLEQLLEQHPDSSAARLARRDLGD